MLLGNSAEKLLILIDNKPRPVIWLHPEDLERLLILRELLKIPLCERLPNLCLICRIDESYTGPLETCTRESPSIDTREFLHYVIDCYQLW